MSINQQQKNYHIGIMGAGAWGTALAVAAGRAGAKTTLYAREAKLAAAINSTKRNNIYLPELELQPAPLATHHLADLALCDIVLLACPAQFLRSSCKALAAILPAARPVLICAKGVEQNSLLLLHEVVAQTLPHNICGVLTGPTFAAEVVQNLPTALTLAMPNLAQAQEWAQILASPHFRPYASDDVIGAQIGGAVKNVLAIACGIALGRGMGDNARAALVTRGLAEILRLGLALGGRAETLMGLSGLGDLTLTCNSLQSRNMSLGAALGRGQTVAQALAGKASVAEGLHSAKAVVQLAQKHAVDMPICTALDAILNHGAPVEQMLHTLLTRPLKAE